MTRAKTIVLSTVGTTGDVEPYLALALALTRRGHGVRVLSHSMHAPRFAAAGIEFRAVAAVVDQAGLNRSLDQILAAEGDPLRQFTRLVHDVFLPGAEAQLPAYLEATRDADLGVCHCFDFLGQEAFIRHGKPWASVFMMPDVIPSELAPPYPFPRLGRFFARSMWQAAVARGKQAHGPIAARLREAGVSERSLGIAGALSPRLNLVAASPSLIQVRADWPENFVATGHWHAGANEQPLEPALAEFLKQNERPVVVTFGSMGGGRGVQTASIVGAALERVGHPAVVQLGYQGLELKGDQIFSVGFAPHAPLFAAAGCVVHHAGAGTAHAAVRAGVPSVTIPHMFDQYYWAGMLHRVGVAPKPLWRGPLQSKSLADAIRRVLPDRKMREKAQKLGTALQGEDGLERAVALIETQLS